jgi:hypothetical protein
MVIMGQRSPRLLHRLRRSHPYGGRCADPLRICEQTRAKGRGHEQMCHMGLGVADHRGDERPVLRVVEKGARPGGRAAVRPDRNEVRRHELLVGCVAHEKTDVRVASAFVRPVPIDVPSAGAR